MAWRLALLILALGACAPVVEEAAPIAPPPTFLDRWNALPDWSTRDRLRRPADVEAMRGLAEANPNSAIAQRRLLVAAFGEGDGAVARDALARMTEMGLLLQPASYEQLSSVVEGAAAVSEQVAPLRSPISASRMAFKIPADIHLSEAIAHDPKTGRWFTGSVVDRSLHMSDDRRVWRLVPTRALGSVMDIAIDHERRILWVSNGKVDPTRDPITAFVGLVAFDLDSLREIRRITAPTGIEALGDIAVAPDGAVLASSPTSGEVWRLGPGRGQLDSLVERGHLSSPQGIALHPSGRFAYVADWAYGIAMVDIESLSLKRLSAPREVALDGSDTLFWHQGSLIAVQNGLSPRRIVRFDLDKAGLEVVGMTTLERAHPDWGEPTTGQLVDGTLFYVSDPQWERWGEGGSVEGEEPLRDNVVRGLPLGGQ